MFEVKSNNKVCEYLCTSRLDLVPYKRACALLQGIVLCIIVIALLFPATTFAQTYTLAEVLDYAQNNSPVAMKNKTSKENKYWQWRTYKSNYKPQLVLNSTLPSYVNNNIPVIQEDGSIIYQTVNRSMTQLNLSLEQNISLTGSKLFISTDISRVDDFNKDSYSYSNSPYYIGLEQPLFAYNNLKWMNRIEPLKYDESLKEYVEDLEWIAYNTTSRFFNLLIAQINQSIAQTNLENAKELFRLGSEKHKMGKISKNELLQLKFGLISGQKSLANASLQHETAQLALGSYTGLQNIDGSILQLPDNITEFLIDEETAIEKAMENSKRSVEFQRLILEAKEQLDKAKKESGLNANLSLSYGTTNVADELSRVYDNPQSMKSVNFGLTIPIVDWGRAKARKKTANANLKMVEYTVNQEKINFKEEIVSQIEYFRTLKNLIEFTNEGDKTAAERFEIARKRYIAEDISFTEYNIALEQKDRAKQDYITALSNYWKTYYYIRILTLYDFEKNQHLGV